MISFWDDVFTNSSYFNCLFNLFQSHKKHLKDIKEDKLSLFSVNMWLLA